ncbi:MAG: hypothetical protein ACYCVH_13065 [Ignavibacteriaceae bacterium]
MDTDITEKIHEYAKQGRVRFKKHALIRSVERNIKIFDIDDPVKSYEVTNSVLHRTGSFALLSFATVSGNQIVFT